MSIARNLYITPDYTTKYQALFDQASDAILTLVVNSKGNISAIDEGNRAFQEMTGFPAPELKSLTVTSLCPRKSDHAVPARTRPLTLEMLEHPGTYEDIAVLRKDGYVRLVELSVRHVPSEEKLFSIALFRDVTEKKNLERELITKHAELRKAFLELEQTHLELKATQDTLVQAGKMAALGELAAGIAHELNQPLQGIRGYAQELQALLKLPPGTEAEFLHEIISNVDKMAKIIHYLRTFTRKSVEGYEQVDLHATLEESLKMLSRQFAARGIEVLRQWDAHLPSIFANPVQVEQVFINLATNARDAIEATGRGKGNLKIKTRADGKFVEITFEDDGCGMNEVTQSKAFNPFFTTKEVGKGMGLGLSMSYGILSKMQGSIVVRSEMGKGAAFVVRLPVDFRELA